MIELTPNAYKMAKKIIKHYAIPFEKMEANKHHNKKQAEQPEDP